jgi:hypothetical protein
VCEKRKSDLNLLKISLEVAIQPIFGAGCRQYIKLSPQMQKPGPEGPGFRNIAKRRCA